MPDAIIVMGVGRRAFMRDDPQQIEQQSCIDDSTRNRPYNSTCVFRYVVFIWRASSGQWIIDISGRASHVATTSYQRSTVVKQIVITQKSTSHVVQSLTREDQKVVRFYYKLL